MNRFASGKVLARASILFVFLLLPYSVQAWSDDDNFMTEYLEAELQQAEEDVADKPDDAYAYVARGSYRSLTGRQFDTVSDFLKAAELDPQLASAYGSRASVLFNMGFIYSALKDVERALDLDSEDPTSLVLRGRIWLEWGSREEAIADFKKAADLQEPAGLKYQALVLMRNGEFEDALANLSTSIESHKVDAETYCWRAIVYRKLGDTEKAEQDEARFKELFARLSPTLRQLVDASPLEQRSMQWEPVFPSENPLTDRSVQSLGVEAAYIDIGPCPFEGCTYGIWKARQDVDAYERPVEGAPVVFTIAEDREVFADTGFVATLTIGKAVVKQPITIGTQTVEEGEHIEVLHYAGEGFSTVRYNGELGQIEVEGVTAESVVPEEAVWWVRCRNSDGEIGWLKDPKGFDGDDVLG